MSMSYHDIVKESVRSYFQAPQFVKCFVEEERPIQIGSSTRIADVVMRDANGRFIAIAECKPEGESKSGREQLKSYMSATNTQFGLLAVGTDRNKWLFCENRGANDFIQISQDAFEAGILNNAPKQPKTVHIWRYITAFLATGLLVALVMLMMQHFKPEQPSVHTIGEVALIPAGEFLMGSNDNQAETDEQPAHTVHLDAFYIDKYEVTNAQYKKFIDANPQWQKNSILHKYHNEKYLDAWQDNTYPPGKENHPVTYVSWYAAMAYAKWVGKRLPTEAEWEKAARGGLVGTNYPWGDTIDPSLANYGGTGSDTMPVGSYPPNAYGLYDMAGNVMEWCIDDYDKSFYERSPTHNPVAGERLTSIVNNFLTVSSYRSVRGGCWYNVATHVRVADRYGTSPNDASRGRGFRCAGNVTNLPK